MKAIIVGGNFSTGRESGVVRKLAESLGADVVNGGSIIDLQAAAVKIKDYKLVLWMPDVNNGEDDVMPIKSVGSIMVVSKVLRKNRTRADAVKRIFKFHGNAVIAITKEGEKFNFEFIDALNNTWVSTDDIEVLALHITALGNWTASAKRVGSVRKKDNLDKLLSITHKVADDVQKEQERFFGNISTRCGKLFPTSRDNNTILVSARNTNKQNLSRNEMVECTVENDKIKYVGDIKPSVDTPIQIELYKIFPQINYMIHGHNTIIGAPTTESYFPCGDMREVQPVAKVIAETKADYGAINLVNHGFLLYADTLERLEQLALEMQIEKLRD